MNVPASAALEVLPKLRPTVLMIVKDHEGNILICKSAKAAKNGETQYTFPQGGISFGKEIKEAAEQELQEELGIDKTKIATFNVSGSFKNMNGNGKNRSDLAGLLKYEGKEMIVTEVTLAEDAEIKVDRKEIAEVKTINADNILNDDMIPVILSLSVEKLKLLIWTLNLTGAKQFQLEHKIQRLDDNFKTSLNIKPKRLTETLSFFRFPNFEVRLDEVDENRFQNRQEIINQVKAAIVATLNDGTSAEQITLTEEGYKIENGKEKRLSPDQKNSIRSQLDFLDHTAQTPDDIRPTRDTPE